MREFSQRWDKKRVLPRQLRSRRAAEHDRQAELQQAHTDRQHLITRTKRQRRFPFPSLILAGRRFGQSFAPKPSCSAHSRHLTALCARASRALASTEIHLAAHAKTSIWQSERSFNVADSFAGNTMLFLDDSHFSGTPIVVQAKLGEMKHSRHCALIKAHKNGMGNILVSAGRA